MWLGIIFLYIVRIKVVVRLVVVTLKVKLHDRIIFARYDFKLNNNTVVSIVAVSGVYVHVMSLRLIELTMVELNLNIPLIFH